MVNNITNNTISEIDAKQGLNTLNEIKNAEIIKHKKYIPKQKESLNLFNNLLDAILAVKTLKPKSQKDNILLTSSKDEHDNDNDNDNDRENYNEKENDNDNENDNENEKGNGNDSNIIKRLNNSLDGIIDKSKSFEDQIKSIRKVENLDEYRFMDDYDNKVLKFKILELELAHLSNIIDKKIFEQIFGHTFETLANKTNNYNKQRRKSNNC